MRILILHNRYQQAGGEDAVVQAETALLRKHQHQVTLIEVDNDGIKSVWKKLQTAFRLTYSKTAREQVLRQIIQFKPDIVHVHNFFPLLTPSIYDACLQAAVPVVQTLHNYRTICPGAFLMREGKICEICVSKSAYYAVQHACYRGSKFGTLAVARMVQAHRQQKTWQYKVNNFIALTEFARTKFISAGFPKEKIMVKPNFVTEPTPSITTVRQGALYIGRISKEKGILTLLKAWQNMPEIALTIAGDGELLVEIRPLLKENITCLGWQNAAEVKELMRRSAFLVMPSEWHETFGMVLIEAFANSLPVIASKLGGMAEIVEEGVTGLFFKAGDANDLANKVRWLQSQPELCKRMGKQAREVYLDKYTPETNHQSLMAIYKVALGNKWKRTTL